jgi:hypothetical protein
MADNFRHPRCSVNGQTLLKADEMLPRASARLKKYKLE